MSTAAIVKDLGKDAAEHVGPWLWRSFSGELEKSAVGKGAKEALTSMYEPLWKQGQAKGRTAIEQIFNNVPESKHALVTQHVVSGVTHPDPIVDGAAKLLRQKYFGQRTAKLVTLDQSARHPNELMRWLDWNQKYAKKYARETVFGEKDELLTHIVKTANIERGHIYANNVADGFSIYFKESGGGEGVNWRRQAGKGIDAVKDLEARSPYYDTKKFESTLRQSMSWMFTPRIAIPHLSQVLNSVLVNGLGNTAKAIGSVMADHNTALLKVAMSGALEDEIHFALEDDIKQAGRSQIGKIVNSLRQPGFKIVRKWQLILSGLGGKYSAQEWAHDFVGGNNKAEVALKFYGLDPNEVRRVGGVLTPDMENTAMFNAAREAMFIRTGLHTPHKWDQTALTRTMFMYKHYMFSEGRLVKEAFKRSAQLGPGEFAKTVATVGILFPAAGTMVKSMMNLATGHPLNDTPQSVKLTKGKYESVDEYLDAMGHVAGFGIGYSIMRAARRRALAENFIGPWLGTGTDMVQDLMNGNFQQLGRDVVSKAGFLGPAASRIILPPKKKGHDLGLSMGLKL